MPYVDKSEIQNLAKAEAVGLWIGQTVDGENALLYEIENRYDVFRVRAGYNPPEDIKDGDSGYIEIWADASVIEDMRIDDLYVSILSWDYV